jgi:thioredoxin-related protein
MEYAVKKRLALLLLLLVTFVSANELKTIYSYQNALYKAKKADKLVMVMMSYSGCPLCNYMKDIVMERPQVLEYLNEHFFVVIKDLQKDHYPERFSVIDSPTFFFIDPKTEADVIPKRSGGFRPDAFLALLKKAAGEEEEVAQKTEQNSTVEKEKSVASLHTIGDNNRSLPTMKPCSKPVGCEESKKFTIN